MFQEETYKAPKANKKSLKYCTTKASRKFKEFWYKRFRYFVKYFLGASKCND